ncbi:MAG: adenylate/guanylate cyclase domain-containing protein [bacterium]
MTEEPDRKLAVLLHADIIGSTALVQLDESVAHRRMQDAFQRLSQAISEHGGATREVRGDALVAEFPRASDAVTAALEFQTANSAHNLGIEGEIRPQIRIGIAMGEVVVADNTVTGAGIVLAQRIEQIAEPGGTCIQGAAYETIPGRLPFEYSYLGEQELKGFSDPVRVYAVSDKVVASPPAQADKPSTVPAVKPSIAVLPLNNMSGDPEQEYFSDGITEDIITELSRFSVLKVIARHSSFSFKGEKIDIKDVAEKLGAQYVVEGSVRRAGNRLRITAQLIEADTGSHIWAERYDRDLEDIFAVQDEITRAIVSVIPTRIQNSMREQALLKTTGSVSAYDYYLRGRWIYDNSAGNDPTAITMLEKAIEIDSTFALGHGLLARIYGYNVFSLGIWYGDQEKKARPHIEKALQYGENDPAIHTVVGQTYWCFGEIKLAKKHFEIALQLNPNNVATMADYGFLIAYEGNPKEGWDWLEKAQQMDPQYDLFSWEANAETLYLLGEYEASIEIYRDRPNPPPHTYTHLAACYAQLGRMEEAREAVAQFKSLCAKDADFPRYAANHARLCNRQEDADNWMEGYRKAGLLD